MSASGLKSWIKAAAYRALRLLFAGDKAKNDRTGVMSGRLKESAVRMNRDNGIRGPAKSKPADQFLRSGTGS
jgi:hypothetical protein